MFAYLADGLSTFRLYHRKDGLIMKERGDLISANRVGLMMLRHASSVEDARNAPAGSDGDYDPLSGAPTGGGWEQHARRGGVRPLEIERM